ncbi:alanine/glycine:cation symporter family protein [Streptomyces sp. NPDC059897]|uniref:alanine/glycine:cation symporter family protein n=1 Tax=Streptomyces sp. NPDC059897 TaxID=3346994 RepID=UPI003648CB5B
MEILSTISGWVWDPLAYVALATGVLFTLVTKGVQFRRVPDMIRQLRAGEAGEGGLSSLQTLALSLSSRIGVGSIAGVATAVASGGPGALLWMVVTALLGATAAYAEAVLAQVYKRRSHGEDLGGMPYYIKYGLKAPWLASVAALATMIAYGFVLPGVQANNIASSAQLAFGTEGWQVGLVLAAVLGVVVVGGTRRIVKVVESVVPFVALGYIISAYVIIALNIEKVPSAISLIVSSGMGVDQVFGGIMGFAVAWGVRRAVFASALGLGEGTFAAAAATVSHPGKQGIVQACSIYIDVLLICTASGLLLVVTGAYNVTDPSGGFLVEHVPGAVAGPNYMQEAIDSSLPGWGAGFVAVAVAMFAFVSMVFFYYVAQTNLAFLLGERRSRGLESLLKAGTVAIAFIGTAVTADAMWAVGDIGYGILGWLNMVCVLLLTPVVRKVIKDYDRQRSQGLDPRFDPGPLGIQGADYWQTQTQKGTAKEPESV